ncbi:MAG: 6-phosphofructokinase [Bacilli bacterium]|nr:6-phosphofructokinase [Bacilli bacterium]
MAKAMVYLQSGGPTAVINSSLYGAITEAMKHDEISGIYGSLNGVEGLIQDDLIDLREEEPETIELLKQTPGAILGTARYKMPSDLTDLRYEAICQTILNHNIGYVFVNGGNDSMDTCAKLAKLFAQQKIDCKVIGVPKTVDNDLAITDHCNGYGSAA